MASKSKKHVSGWICPKCGRQFARKSAYHGCGQYTVEGYLAGKTPEAIALFNLLVETAQQPGEITISPAKTQISFRVKTTFLMVALSGRQLTGYLFLPREAPAPFFRKITSASARRFVHHFRIADQQTITGPFAKLMAEAIELQSANDSAVEKDNPLSIGEEINALYRSDRTARRAEISRPRTNAS
jgi:hypothetical protein